MADDNDVQTPSTFFTRLGGLIADPSVAAAANLFASAGVSSADAAVTTTSGAAQSSAQVDASATNDPLANQTTTTQTVAAQQAAPIPRANLTSAPPTQNNSVQMPEEVLNAPLPRPMTAVEAALHDYQDLLVETTPENAALRAAVEQRQQGYDSNITPYQEAYARAEREMQVMFAKEEEQLLERRAELQKDIEERLAGMANTKPMLEERSRIKGEMKALEERRDEALENAPADSKYLLEVLSKDQGQQISQEQLAFYIRQDNEQAFDKHFKAIAAKLDEGERAKFEEAYERHKLVDNDRFMAQSHALIGELDKTNQAIDAQGEELKEMQRQERQMDRLLIERRRQYERDQQQLQDRFFKNPDTYEQYKVLAARIDATAGMSTQDRIDAKEKLAGAVAFSDNEVELTEKLSELNPELGISKTNIESKTATKVFNVYVGTNDAGEQALFMKEANSRNAEAVEITDPNVAISGAGKGDRVMVQFNEGVTSFVKDKFNGSKLNFIGDDQFHLDYGAPGMTYDVPAHRYVRENEEGRKYRRPQREIIRGEDGAPIMKTMLNYNADKYENPADIVEASTLSQRNQETLDKRGQAAEMRFEEQYQKNMYHLDKSLAHGAERLAAVQGARASMNQGVDNAAAQVAAIRGKGSQKNTDTLAELQNIQKGLNLAGVTGGREERLPEQGLNFDNGVAAQGAQRQSTNQSVVGTP